MTLSINREFIVSGTHFSNFAVQEPGGVMILEAKYGEQVKEGDQVGKNKINLKNKQFFLPQITILFLLT